MSVHSSQKCKKKDWTRIKFTGIGSYKNFLQRIRKTLYYGDLPLTERLSLPVTELAADLYSEVKSRHSVERLRLDEASEISRQACVSPCTLVLALIYLDHLKSSNYCYVNRVSPSDLFIVSLIVATKFLNDSGEEDDVLNSEWAASVGLTLDEINRLEREFLLAINWEVYVKHNHFWRRLRLMEQDVALKEGNKRGWFSYTDLESLLDTINGLALAQVVFTVSAVCLASYTAGFLTIIGSTLLVTHIPKYSVILPQQPQPSNDFTTQVPNISTNTNVPLHPMNSQDFPEDCQPQTVNNYAASENAIKEIIKYMENEQIKWNLKNETNFSHIGNTYFNIITSYIKTLSKTIQCVPINDATLSMGTSYFLHNCFS